MGLGRLEGNNRLQRRILDHASWGLLVAQPVVAHSSLVFLAWSAELQASVYLLSLLVSLVEFVLELTAAVEAVDLPSAFAVVVYPSVHIGRFLDVETASFLLLKPFRAESALGPDINILG
jgi:hypothetical protein